MQIFYHSSERCSEDTKSLKPNVVHSSDTTIWPINCHFREMFVKSISGFQFARIIRLQDVLVLEKKF
jgi:hypothetical protein